MNENITVGELIARLKAMPQDAIVKCWLPGQHIALSSVFPFKDEVRIEGNLEDGE